MAKRDIILDTILAGGATRDDLLEAAEVDVKGLASQFTYLRMMGKCPLLGEDGTYSIISQEEWETLKASRCTGSTTARMTPQERLDKATVRLEKATKATNKASEKSNALPEDKVLSLRYVVADAQFKLASIEFERAESLLVEKTASEEDDD